MLSPAVPVTVPSAASSLLPGALRPSPSSFLLPLPTPPTMVSPGARWRWGVGGREEAGGGGAGAWGVWGGGRSALPLPLVSGAVDAAASPAAGTPALTRDCLTRGHPAQVRPLSQVSYLHPARGRSILALPCSHFILRCFACGEGDRPCFRGEGAGGGLKGHLIKLLC